MKVAQLLVVLGFCALLPARLAGQDPSSEIDLLYPEYAHPVADAQAAIARHDYRFIAVDRARKIVPGMNHATRLRRQGKVRFLRQRLRLFATASENFSFNLRAHAYAEEYNLYLAHFLATQTAR